MKLSRLVIFLAMFAINPSVTQAGIYPPGVETTPDIDADWNGLLLAADSEQQKQDGSTESQTQEEPDCE